MDELAVGEQMWFAEHDPIGKTFRDSTRGRDDLIPQALFDHGGYLVYDITKPNAIMPVLAETSNGRES